MVDAAISLAKSVSKGNEYVSATVWELSAR